MKRVVDLFLSKFLYKKLFLPVQSTSIIVGNLVVGYVCSYANLRFIDV
jgi:hypothetical protein